MIPSIAFDFNFDYVLFLIFTSYIIYGYLSGGHKQIRLSINLILPFIMIYYLGKYITAYLYVPLSNSFVFTIMSEIFNAFKYTFTMILAYVVTYFALFFFVFLLSVYARRHILNENMRAKLGKKNYYLGALFAFINGYVLIYFIILPAFSMNIVSSNAYATNFVLNNPPPFSRIARTAEKAVPVKSLADKAGAFQELLSAEGIEGYYNDSIYEYQQTYIGGSESLEFQFMNDVYSHLSIEAKELLDDEYYNYMNIDNDFGEELILSRLSYTGVSRVLVEEMDSGKYLYEELLELENDFEEYLQSQQDIVDAYEGVLNQYEIDKENYDYQLIYDQYLDDLETFNTELNAHLTAKITAIKNGEVYLGTFTGTVPKLTETEPDNYVEYDTSNPPVYPEVPTEVPDAEDYILLYEDKADVRQALTTFGKDFLDHKGLLIFYVDNLGMNLASSSDGGNIDLAINVFKNNYDDIIANINDEELEDKLELAKMSITSYDVFTNWLSCTEVHIDNAVPLEELGEEQYRCTDIDVTAELSYDFTEEALSLATSVFKGDTVSWYILQFKYDYESGGFEEELGQYEEIMDILDGMKELSDEYDLYYKDIANSIEGNISMVFKIGISVAKFNIDMYDTLENTPLLSAMFNDIARMCSNEEKSSINRNVVVCTQSEGSGGFVGEALNMRYLASEVVFKAYVMVDDENEQNIYDTEAMNEYLALVNESVENNVIAPEVVEMFGDQLAFNVIDSNTNYTLLEQMYDDGQITIEAMRVLADDEYELFSEEFRLRVRSLIR